MHFDTAQAYGCGHSEIVLGEALKPHPDVAIATKIGLETHTETKQLVGPITDPDHLRQTIEASRKRLGRDTIDLVLAIEQTNLLSLIRSTLTMGLLGGKYDAKTQFSKDEIRGSNLGWQDYFKDGKITDHYMGQLNAVGEILKSDGRILAQGALAWLWGQTPNAMPIPGFRTPKQLHDLCGALAYGPLTPAQMTEVAAVLNLTDPA